MKIKHSLVVPCYNEEGCVEQFLLAAEKEMAAYTKDYEIVFVNDGSSDHTPEILRRLFAEHRETKIQVISFSRNFGKEAAIYAGMQAAAGDYVTIIDADLQQRPEIAVQMGEILDAHPEYDVVAAYQEIRKEGKFISFCKKEFYRVINKMTEVEFISNASDFRTLRRPVAETILALPEYHRFSKGLFSWVGYNTFSIPYAVQERASGSSKWNFGKLLKYAVNGIVSYTDLPLKWPLYMGGLSCFFSFVLLIVMIVLQCTLHANLLLGWLCCVLLFLFGLLSVSQGILGVYLGKVHTQVKNRPVYITKEKLTYDNKSF